MAQRQWVCPQHVLAGFFLAATAFSAIGQTVAVTRYEVAGNTLLPTTDVDKALANHTGPKDLEGLRAASSALQNSYRMAGYGAVVVTLPEQTLADGTVKLQVTEGKLGQVQVTGVDQFSTANIRRSLPALQEGTTPNLLKLDAQTLLANDNPAKNIRLVFQPGLRTGQVDVVVSAQEEPISQWVVGLDNTGRPGSGEYRVSAAYTHANVADQDHVLRLRLETALQKPADNPMLAVAYRVPLYGLNSALDFNLTHSRSLTESTSTAAGDLSFSGQGQSLGARFMWFLPQAGESKQQIAAGVDFRNYRNACAVAGLGQEACGTSGNNQIGVRPLVLSYQNQAVGRHMASVSYSANLWPGSGNGADANFQAARPGAKARYSVLRGQWSSVHATGDNSWLTVKTSGQWAPKALISAEQFGIGGANTVRGYLDRELVGDRGYSASLDWTHNLQPWLPGFELASGQSLNGNLFVDTGGISNLLGTACTTGQTVCSLSSVGMGLQWAHNKRWTLKADIARALRTGPSTASGKARLHLNASHQF